MGDGIRIQALAGVGEDQDLLRALCDGVVQAGRLAAVLGMAQHCHARILQGLGSTCRVLVVTVDGQQHADPVGRIVALQAAPDLRPDQVGSVAGHDDHGDLGLRRGVRAACRLIGPQLLQLPVQQPRIACIRVHHPPCGEDVGQQPEGVHRDSVSRFCRVPPWGCAAVGHEAFRVRHCPAVAWRAAVRDSASAVSAFPAAAA